MAAFACMIVSSRELGRVISVISYQLSVISDYLWSSGA
ncbi:hypothetical protein VL20_5869 [Microcystis panniformis FACHB-1757]|uniref:Uncharacterized protein n=1 Tax=Microcystis panniformis FACHB-1757 TaxID=1638788 RepID=A0A0K1S964_9CHRO|nr:hypothetical protein VL20_5869 [Microcystis panniformis FACHB-1757]